MWKFRVWVRELWEWSWEGKFWEWSWEDFRVIIARAIIGCALVVVSLVLVYYLPGGEYFPEGETTALHIAASLLLLAGMVLMVQAAYIIFFSFWALCVGILALCVGILALCVVILLLPLILTVVVFCGAAPFFWIIVPFFFWVVVPLIPVLVVFLVLPWSIRNIGETGAKQWLSTAWVLLLVLTPSSLAWSPVSRSAVDKTSAFIKTQTTAAHAKTPQIVSGAVWDYMTDLIWGQESKAPRVTFGQPLRSYKFRKNNIGDFQAPRKHGGHQGLDLVAKVGTRVVATKDGKVIYADKQGNYGKIVKVMHADGYETRYAHLSKISVRKGERVKQGQVIGKVGRTGNARDVVPHLHYEIRLNGKVLDPKPFILPSR